MRVCPLRIKIFKMNSFSTYKVLASSRQVAAPSTLRMKRNFPTVVLSACLFLVCINVFPIVSCQNEQQNQQQQRLKQQQQRQQQSLVNLGFEFENPHETFSQEEYFSKANTSPGISRNSLELGLTSSFEQMNSVESNRAGKKGNQQQNKIGTTNTGPGDLHKRKNYKDRVVKKYHQQKQQEVQQQQDSKLLNNLKYVQSEKKYFDYFPIEEVNLEYNPNDDKIEVVLLNHFNNIEKSAKRKGKKASESLEKKQQRRKKREINEQNKKDKRSLIPVGFYPSYSTPNDPWSSRFSSQPTGYNNYPSVVSPVITYIKYPIQGLYWNPYTPPANYLPVRTDILNQKPNHNNVPEMPTDVGTRFDQDEISEAPFIWGVRNQAAQRPVETRKTTQAPTTRRPPPPLIHTENRPSNVMNSIFTTPRPIDSQQSIQRSQDVRNLRTDININNIRPIDSEDSQSRTEVPSSNVRPQQARTTTRAPQRRQQPSSCVWAIVNCCTGRDLSIRYSCFEKLGCHGSFWGLNPCADQYRNAAIDETDEYYENLKK